MEIPHENVANTKHCEHSFSEHQTKWFSFYGLTPKALTATDRARLIVVNAERGMVTNKFSIIINNQNYASMNDGR